MEYCFNIPQIQKKAQYCKKNFKIEITNLGKYISIYEGTINCVIK